MNTFKSPTQSILKSSPITFKQFSNSSEPNFKLSSNSFKTPLNQLWFSNSFCELLIIHWSFLNSFRIHVKLSWNYSRTLYEYLSNLFRIHFKDFYNHFRTTCELFFHFEFSNCFWTVFEFFLKSSETLFDSFSILVRIVIEYRPNPLLTLPEFFRIFPNHCPTIFGIFSIFFRTLFNFFDSF